MSFRSMMCPALQLLTEPFGLAWPRLVLAAGALRGRLDLRKPLSTELCDPYVHRQRATTSALDSRFS